MPAIDDLEETQLDSALLDEVRADRVGLVIGTVQRLLDANAYYAGQIGYSIDEVRGGVSWVSLTPVQWIGADMRAIGEMRAVGRSGVYRKQYVRRDGTFCDLDICLGSGGEDRIVALTATVGDAHAAQLVSGWAAS